MQKVMLLLENIKGKLQFNKDSEYTQLCGVIDKVSVFELETVTGYDAKTYKEKLAELKKEIQGSKLILKDLIPTIPDTYTKDEKPAITEYILNIKKANTRLDADMTTLKNMETSKNN